MSEIITLLFNPDGRISRSQYFTTTVLLGLGIAVITLLLFFASPILAMTLGYILSMTYFASYLILSIKRSHDIGKSGWIVILLFIPIISLFSSLYLFLAKGQIDINKYGGPSEASDPILIATCIFLSVMPFILLMIGMFIAMSHMSLEITSM